MNVIVSGAAGRMGQAIVGCLLAEAVPGLRLAGALDAAGSPALGSDAGRLAGGRETGVMITADPQELPPADVLIDFSVAQAAPALAAYVTAQGLGWVLGTTGLSPEALDAVQQAAGKVPVVMAPNMSLGVNLLLKLVEDAARALKDRGYDVEIVERHHRRKKDAPSGTALGLGEAVARGLDCDLAQVARHGRQGLATGDRPAQEIGFHAVRAGDFVGDHTVLFATDGESVELSHRATSRDTFAIGALRAAAWLEGRAPGLYRMRDVLGV